VFFSCLRDRQQTVEGKGGGWSRIYPITFPCCLSHLTTFQLVPFCVLPPP
jgi:hypothetical protein